MSEDVQLPPCLISLLWDRVPPWPTASEAIITIVIRVVMMGNAEQRQACVLLYSPEMIRKVADSRYVHGLHPMDRSLLDNLLTWSDIIRRSNTHEHKMLPIPKCLRDSDL
jgi:hypothetical protein